MEDTAVYLRIIALGLPFCCVYNVLSASCRSIGDTRMPLICLVSGAVMNIGLDLLFVAVFHWGCAGAAVATILSQAVCAMLCGVLLWRMEPILRIRGKDLRVDSSLLKRTMHYSYATALQQAGVYVGKLVIQGMVNPLGVNAIAAYSAVNRVDDYALIPQRDIASGMTTGTAQNRGAGKPERMMRFLTVGLCMQAIYGLLISIVVVLLPTQLIQLFVDSSEEEVLRIGTSYLRAMGFLYFLPGITNGLQGYMRGLGKMNITMLATYLQMLVRAIITALAIGTLGLNVIPPACLCGWLVMALLEIVCILVWKKKGTLFAGMENGKEKGAAGEA